MVSKLSGLEHDYSELRLAEKENLRMHAYKNASKVGSARIEKAKCVSTKYQVSLKAFA